MVVVSIIHGTDPSFHYRAVAVAAHQGGRRRRQSLLETTLFLTVKETGKTIRKINSVGSPTGIYHQG
jgi:hypothetical protein